MTKDINLLSNVLPQHYSMTLRELLKVVSFDEVIACHDKEEDLGHIQESFQKARDILLNLPDQTDDLEEVIITEEEDLVTHKTFLYAFGCEGEKWSLFIDSPIYVPAGVKLEKPMVVYIILSALTYWGVTPE